MTSDKLTVNELFSGIGAQRKALERLGIDHEVVGICEIDKYAIQSYEAIFGKTKNYGDICTAERLDYADLWTYSFPCQDISVAGKQQGINENTRSGLLYQVQRLLEVAKVEGTLPKYLLLENVKNLVGKQFKEQFFEWIYYLSELGYDTYWQVLNAKNYGIPQNRERVFAISIRKDLNQTFEFPQIEELKLRLKDVLEDEVNEKFYINNDKVNNLILNIKNKFEKQQCSYCIDANYWKGGTAEQFLNKSRRQLVVIGSTQKNAYIGDGEMSPTLTSAMGMGGGHVPMLGFDNLRIRKLTPLECWRLMGFDDEDFHKAQQSGVSNSQLYKQAGNSIVVNVLEKIFKNLF